jgi:hypothetical protein
MTDPKAALTRLQQKRATALDTIAGLLEVVLACDRHIEELLDQMPRATETT